MGRIKVSGAVLDGLEAVRHSGETNMLDRPVVARLASELGYEEAARWIESHHREYAQGIFRGFEAAEGEHDGR